MPSQGPKDGADGSTGKRDTNGSGQIIQLASYSQRQEAGRQIVEGSRGAARFRYHRESFRRTLAIAIGLTTLVCGLVWLLLGIYGTRYMNVITAATGLVFFAFISARMLVDYFRDEVVMAIQPTGLFDVRIGPDTIPWEAIKELVLKRQEQDYTLRVVMWPAEGRRAADHEVSLSVLEGGTRPVLEALQSYMSVRMEH